jgi:hypothetical protein
MSIHFPFISPVTGVTFYSDALAKVREGMVAELYHDKGNQFDSNAVAVKVSGSQVGFLPKELARRVVQSGGEFWSGIVVNVLKSHNGIGLRLSVDHQSEPKQKEVIKEDINLVLKTNTPVELEEVKAKSGRLLGTLISKDSTHTKVLTPQGRQVIYPNGLLQLN